MRGWKWERKSLVKYQSKYETAWAASDDLLIIKTGEWRYQRPVTKSEKCCQGGWCYLYCPTGCIVAGETHFFANLDYCKGCGICARVCTVNAIRMVEE